MRGGPSGHLRIHLECRTMSPTGSDHGVRHHGELFQNEPAAKHSVKATGVSLIRSYPFSVVSHDAAHEKDAKRLRQPNARVPMASSPFWRNACTMCCRHQI